MRHFTALITSVDFGGRPPATSAEVASSQASESTTYFSSITLEGIASSLHRVEEPRRRQRGRHFATLVHQVQRRNPSDALQKQGMGLIRLQLLICYGSAQALPNLLLGAPHRPWPVSGASDVLTSEISRAGSDTTARPLGPNEHTRTAARSSPSSHDCTLELAGIAHAQGRNGPRWRQHIGAVASPADR